MTRPPKMTDSEVAEALEALPGWQLSEGKLHRSWRFKSFVVAFGWMSSAAIVAEKMNHHPSWSNVYDTVDVDLWTHDAGGLTELDFELARKMTTLAERFGGK